VKKDQIKVLVLVDSAIAKSGPHRNVVASLNALSMLPQISLTLLANEYDQKEAFACSETVRIVEGFNPKSKKCLLQNQKLLRDVAKSQDIVYTPCGLKSFLYAYFFKGSAKLVAGPNVAGIPVLMPLYNPGPLMTTHMADAWIENSEVRKKRCIQGGTSPDRINVIYHALSSEQFHPQYRDRGVWNQYGIQPDDTILIHVGCFDEEIKGIPQLLSGFEKLKETKDNVRLVLIGRKGSYLPEKAPAGVHYLGYKSSTELRTLYASADAFVGTSLDETFWFTPLEAMASGIPIFVTSVGAVPMMIKQNGEQGFVFDIFEDDKFSIKSNAAETIGKTLSDNLEKPKIENCGKLARMRFEEYFTEKRLGQDLFAVFEKTLLES
jgi:glycosyltransferase involved in cell wall biosynthesis